MLGALKQRPVSPKAAGDRIRSAKRVLLVKPHHRLGDLLVSTPLIRNLRRALPDAELDFIAGRYNAPAVLDNPDLNTIHVPRLQGPAAILDWMRLVPRLRSKQYDVAIMLSTISHSKTAVSLAKQAGAKFVCGFDDSPYGSTLAQRYHCVLDPPENLKTHIVDYNLTLLERLGIPASTKEHVLGVTQDQREKARDALRKVGLRAPVIGVQPGGNPLYPDRRWASEHYAALIKKVQSAVSLPIVLLGTEADRPAIEELQAKLPRSLPTLLGLPFPVYKAVLQQLSYFVTHDGGPVHVAAGVRVPSTFVFLSTPPWRWAPYGEFLYVWTDYKRIPSGEELWERMEPRLRAVLSLGAS